MICWGPNSHGAGGHTMQGGHARQGGAWACCGRCGLKCQVGGRGGGGWVQQGGLGLLWGASLAWGHIRQARGGRGPARQFLGDCGLLRQVGMHGSGDEVRQGDVGSGCCWYRKQDSQGQGTVPLATWSMVMPSGTR